MRHGRFAGDPLEALRRADPLDPREVPTDTTGPEARALFLEVTSMSTTSNRPIRSPRTLLRRVALGAGIAAVAAAVAGTTYGLMKGDAEEAIVGGEPIGSPMAMCIQYTEQMLLDQEFAFDGTLSAASADGTQATFEVHRWFKGGEGGQITLGAEGLFGEESLALDGMNLQVGQRYLISGTDGFVWACGYSLTYDTAIADHWAEIFGA